MPGVQTSIPCLESQVLALVLAVQILRPSGHNFVTKVGNMRYLGSKRAMYVNCGPTSVQFGREKISRVFDEQ
jgi:hypothetical protein